MRFWTRRPLAFLAGVAATLLLGANVRVAPETPRLAVIPDNTPVVDPAALPALAVAQPSVHVLRAIARDLDRDGDLDVVASTTEDPIVVWINDGHGHYTRQRPSPAPLVAVSANAVASAPPGDVQAAPPTPKWWGAPPDRQKLIAQVELDEPAPARPSPGALGGVVSIRPIRAPPSLRLA